MECNILSLGSNGGGQLGIGHLEDVSKPTTCLFVFATPNSRPKKIAAGGNHTLLLFEDGSLFTTGTNVDGRCGLPAQKEPFTTFQPISFKDAQSRTVDRFRDVAATWEASVFLGLDNEVYVCGSGSKGELGQGVKITRLELPTRLPSFPPQGKSINSLSACMGHVVAVLATGEVYGWGAGRKGQLGEPSQPIVGPRQIDTGDWKCSGAVCGQAFTVLFVDPSGPARFRVLGDDKWGVRSQAPDLGSKWESVGASWGSVFVLSEDGTLVNWGRNDHGQLSPRGLPKLRSVAAGSEHVLAETVDGFVIAWGWGEHGNCGVPIEANGDVKDTWNVLGNGQVLGAGCATSWMVRKKDP